MYTDPGRCKTIKNVETTGVTLLIFSFKGQSCHFGDLVKFKKDFLSNYKLQSWLYQS